MNDKAFRFTNIIQGLTAFKYWKKFYHRSKNAMNLRYLSLKYIIFIYIPSSGKEFSGVSTKHNAQKLF